MVNVDPRNVFYSYLTFILLSIVLVVAIDFLNLFNVKSYLIGNLSQPLFWYHWFLTPLENPLQWYTLSAAVVVFAVNAGLRYSDERNDDAKFFAFLTLGLCLMLVEDAGDVRHMYRGLMENYFDSTSYGFLGTTFELIYFSVIAVIFLYPFIKYRSVYWNCVQPRFYFIVGILMYAIAVSSSWAGSAFEGVTGYSFYIEVGRIINSNLILDEVALSAYEIAVESTTDDFINSMLMDRVYEESLELLGAAALMTAGLCFLRQYREQDLRGEANGTDLTEE